MIGGDAAGAAEPLRDGDGRQPAARHRTESKVLIIGSGPAGLTAAIYAARANLEPIVIAGSTPGGQLMLTSEVENYPGFPEGIEGPELMRRFREQAERFGTQLVDVDIERVDLSAPPVPHLGARHGVPRAERDRRDRRVGDLAGARERDSACGAAVSAPARRATGSSSGTARSPSSAAATPRWRSRSTSRSSPARSTCSTVAKSSGRSKIMIDRALEHPKIEVHTNTEVDEVLGDAKVDGLRLRDTETGEQRELPMEGLFIAIGHKPNTDVFRDWLEVDQKGYLVVHDHTRSSDRRRVHRRRRPRPPLSPGGDRGGRWLHGRHRRRALARGRGHHGGGDSHCLVNPSRRWVPLRDAASDVTYAPCDVVRATDVTEGRDG